MGNKAAKSDLKTSLVADVVIPLRNLAKYGSPDMFTCLAMETTSWCNRSCDYCPSGKYKKENVRLDAAIVHRVFDQLGEMEFDGTIFLHLFNEPLYDKRIAGFVGYARKKCPVSKISISSNGDNLDLKLMRSLIDEGIDRLFVTQYDGKVNDNVKEVQQALIGTDRQKLTVRVQNVFESNRAGLVPSLKIEETLKEPCYRPKRMLVVNAWGKVLLCCNDYFGKEVLGDAATEPLVKIWRSRRFKYLRKRLEQGDRTVSELCRACNEITPKETVIEDISKTNAYKKIKDWNLYG